MCQGVLASAAAVQQAVSGTHRCLLNNLGFLAGCLVMQGTNFVGLV